MYHHLSLYLTLDVTVLSIEDAVKYGVIIFRILNQYAFDSFNKMSSYR